MQVYKFGGASIAGPEVMRKVVSIIQKNNEPLVVVVSALGKTTNELEHIVNHAIKGDKAAAKEAAKVLEDKHVSFATDVLDEKHLSIVKKRFEVLFTELDWAIDEAGEERPAYSYDQIVCMGELLSTALLHGLLLQEGVKIDLLDSRDLIITDDTYRDAVVHVSETEKRVQQTISPLLIKGMSVLIQGFIGSTTENTSVTLGREGSDYTAALIASIVGASGVSIWKDVEGLYNADPKLFPNAVKIEAITYHEVIEMAFYGAQVVHPKTIKPLQNNGIPLYIKCFLKPSVKGTIVTSEINSIFYPPLIVLKENQVLLQFTTKDFSFITQDNLSKLYKVFHDRNLKINLTQNAAISFVACIDNQERKIEAVVADLESDYKIFRNEEVSLLTIRHYTNDLLQEMLKGKYQLLEQKTRNTIQAVIK